MAIGDQVLAVRHVEGQRPEADTGTVIAGNNDTIQRDHYSPGAVDYFPNPCQKLPPELDDKPPVQAFSKSTETLQWRCRYGDLEVQYIGRRYIRRGGVTKRVLERKLLDLRHGRRTVFKDIIST